MRTFHLFLLALLFTLVVAACSPAEPQAPAADTGETMPQEDDMSEDSADEAAMADTADEAMADEAMAAWQTISLTNAVTGESFTLADFAGRTVFVEPMATWCTNCRRQLANVAQARAQLGEEVVFVGLSLETNLSDAELAEYAAGNGFDWTWAVMSEEMLQQLAQEFGRTITNAPSTPHFIIRPDGSFTELATGIDSPDQIVAQITAAQ